MEARIINPVPLTGNPTFLHNDTPLIDAVLDTAEYITLDNGWTRMTGYQPNPKTGINVPSEPVPRASLRDAVIAIEDKHLQGASPYDMAEAVDAINLSHGRTRSSRRRMPPGLPSAGPPAATETRGET